MIGGANVGGSKLNCGELERRLVILHGHVLMDSFHVKTCQGCPVSMLDYTFANLTFRPSMEKARPVVSPLANWDCDDKGNGIFTTCGRMSQPHTLSVATQTRLDMY